MVKRGLVALAITAAVSMGPAAGLAIADPWSAAPVGTTSAQMNASPLLQAVAGTAAPEAAEAVDPVADPVSRGDGTDDEAEDDDEDDDENDAENDAENGTENGTDDDTDQAPTGTDETSTQVDAAAVSPNRFVATAPTRIFDTRRPGSAKVNAGATITVNVTGNGRPVPAEATAVVANLTLTETEGTGYVSVWPAGRSQPTASSANVEFSDQTIANLVTVPLGTNGALRVFTQPRTHVIVDVFGYYVPATSASAGRFVGNTPYRLLDTRFANALQWGTMPPNSSITVDVAAFTSGIAGAPQLPADATAVAINLTATDTAGPGFFGVQPAGATPGLVSNLNATSAGQTLANQVISRVVDRKFSIYTQTGGHLVVDLVGYYTGAGAATSATGLFVPLTPARLLDTRPGMSNSPLAGAKPQASQTLGVTTASRGGLPTSGFSAVVLNATATQTTAPGFVTLWSAGGNRPPTSNLNATRADQTVANHAIVPVSTAGFSVLTQSGSHLVADVAGYFTGNAPAAPAGYVPNSAGFPPSVGSHKFMYTFPDGSYARWNPCRPITYALNLTGAPSFARREVDAAITKVEAATGLDFQYVGDTTAGLDGRPPTGVDTVIAFGTPSQNAALTGAAGLGGGAYSPAWNGADPRVVNGFVLVNRTITFSEGLGGNGLQGLLLHELGHMIGLDHVGDYGEVMYPVMHPVPNGYGPGDRQGLWALGAAQGCLRLAGGAFSTQSLGDGGATGDGTPPLLTATREDGDAPVFLGFCDLGARPQAAAVLQAALSATSATPATPAG